MDRDDVCTHSVATSVIFPQHELITNFRLEVKVVYLCQIKSYPLLIHSRFLQSVGTRVARTKAWSIPCFKKLNLRPH